MKKPKNFDKIYDTSIWWHSYEIGKQVEGTILPAEYIRDGMDPNEYTCLWLTELYGMYKMTHRMMLEINWKAEQILVHIMKEEHGDEGVIINNIEFTSKDFASYRVFVKMLNRIAVHHSHRFWGK